MGRRSKFGPGHVEFEVLATHDHEAGCGAGTPDIGSLKIDINTEISHPEMTVNSLGMNVVPPLH